MVRSRKATVERAGRVYDRFVCVLQPRGAGEGGDRREGTSPFRSRSSVCPMCGSQAPQAGHNIAPFNSGPVCVSHPSPTAPSAVLGPASWTRRGRRTAAVTLVGLRRQPDRVSIDIVRSRPRRHENRPPLINGGALTGLSTLCPRRRSPANQVAVVKGWITPSTTLAVGRAFGTPPGTEHRPFHSRRKVRRKPAKTPLTDPLGRRIL